MKIKSGAFALALTMVANVTPAQDPPASSMPLAPTGPAWSIVTSPNTSTGEWNFLNGVTCTSASDCWTVGYYRNSGVDQICPGCIAGTLIEHWNGTAWSIVTSPNTSATQLNYLNDVTCASASDCWAVGSYYNGSVGRTLIEHWNGTAWSIVNSPNAMGWNGLSGVTCTSASDCWAVGSYGHGDLGQTFIEHWNGTAWSIVNSPNTSATQDNQLRDVTCTSASNCWAVGQYSFGRTLTEHWNGTAWSIVRSPNTSTGHSHHLLGVTCTSASECWAVGDYFTGTIENHPAIHTLIERWNGTAWSIVTSPTTTLFAHLREVTCASASDCWAVGDDSNHTLTEHWNGTAWSIVTSPNAIGPNYLKGVTCASASDCWTVGSYYSGSVSRTLIERYATGALSSGYTVTLQQVGPNVVATGSGAINLTGLTSYKSSSVGPGMRPNRGTSESINASITTGPTSSSVDLYRTTKGPSFGSSSSATSASSGSGDMVGIHNVLGPYGYLVVPAGYVSGTALSDMAIYSDATFATLGVTPGTYVWTWGPGANQNFTLKILSAKLPAPKITNISTRASVQMGEGVTIAGFIITGTVPKQIVIRGLGPSLGKFIANGIFLNDPRLDLYDANGALIRSNNDWKETQQTAIQATGLAPSFDLESAIRITLQPGRYTAILSATGDPQIFGLGLVEVYDLNPGASAELTNVSTRGRVGGGNEVMIAGFISNGSTQVLVRGLGPTLAQHGVLDPLADPVLILVDSNGNVVLTNNNWKATDEAAITATGKAPRNDLEAAILAPVAAGNYTAILSGNGGGTGIGLLEVYK